MKLDVMVLTLFLGVITSAISLANPGPGMANCEFDAQYHCRVAWNLAQDPRTLYQIERFEPILQEWQVEEYDVESRGLSADHATPGHLYRVVGCNVGSSDRADAEQDCVSTTATWAPVVPDSVDKIPDMVFDHQGAGMRINKSNKLRTQILQLNVYLLARDLGPVDVSGFPRMAKVTWVAETTGEMIWDNVSAVYNALIDQALGIPTDPGPENTAGYRHDEDHVDH